MLTRAQLPADSEIDRLTASAEKGDVAAQLKLGMYYYIGEGRRHPPDYAEALKWFRLAGDQGNAQAQDPHWADLLFREGRAARLRGGGSLVSIGGAGWK